MLEDFGEQRYLPCQFGGGSYSLFTIQYFATITTICNYQQKRGDNNVIVNAVTYIHKALWRKALI